MTFHSSAGIGLLLSGTLLTASCALPTISVSAPPPAGINAVPCVSVPQIGYHSPKDPAQNALWEQGKLPDPTNRYDTPDTVHRVREANAATGAVCVANAKS